MLLTPQVNAPHSILKSLLGLCLILLSSPILISCSPLIVAGTVAGAGVMVASDRRSTEHFFEDEAIEIEATDYIYSNKKFGKLVHISVISFNGTVLLVGETLDKSSKQAIFREVSKIGGVKNVIDAIEVRSLASVSSRSHDTWVTSKVKSHIIAKKGPLTRTKVVTARSNVYLMGIVSNDEARQILEIVKNVDGVKTVTPLFEPMEGDLDVELAATTYMKPATYPTTTPKSNKTTSSIVDAEIEAEDDIIVLPYVLQPAIQMNTDEKQLQ